MTEVPEADERRIDVERANELRYWSEHFGVTEEEIRQAVKAVGPKLDDVRQRLARNRSY
jgi:hypothetical protein